MHKHHMTAILVGGIAGLVIGYTQAATLNQYPVYMQLYNYIASL